MTLEDWGKCSLCFFHASFILSSAVPLSCHSSSDKGAMQPDDNERDTSQGAFG